MQFSLETLAALATIVGTLISVLALIQSRTWLLLTSLIIVVLGIGAVLYGRRERIARNSASTVIEGFSIDSLNMANLKRRVDREFFVQDAEHVAIIDGTDMRLSWRYAGYCRVDRSSAFSFSVDSEAGKKFDDLECVAYDLRHDAQMLNPIRPLMVSTEGISKKLSVPLLEPIAKDQPFALALQCILKGCLTPGIGYYCSTLSFAQDRVGRCKVRLEFVGDAPAWVRVYDCSPGQPARLLKTLRPSQKSAELCCYLDVIENIPGQSARVYLFWRDSV